MYLKPEPGNRVINPIPVVGCFASKEIRRNGHCYERKTSKHSV